SPPSRSRPAQPRTRADGAFVANSRSSKSRGVSSAGMYHLPVAGGLGLEPDGDPEPCLQLLAEDAGKKPVAELPGGDQPCDKHGCVSGLESPRFIRPCSHHLPP